MIYTPQRFPGQVVSFLRYSILCSIVMIVLAATSSTGAYAHSESSSSLRGSGSSLSVGLDNATTLITEAPANTVWFTHPDSNSSHPKPAGVGYPNESAWSMYVLSSGIILGMEKNPQYTTLDTYDALFSPVDGRPLVNNNRFVIVAPPSVEAQVAYYESRRIAPLYLSGNSSHLYWNLSNGTVLTNTVTAPGNLTGGWDLFVLEFFQDEDSNYVLCGYGLTPKGSMAAAIFFKTVRSQPLSYADSWYVALWQDANANGIPDSNDNFTLIASQTNHEIQPIPEFPTGIAFLMMLGSVFFALAITRKKRSESTGHHRNQIH